MNKKIVAISIIIAVAVGGGILYLASSPADMPEAANTSTTALTQARPAEPTPASGQPGAYIDYTPSAIATTTGTKLLFFHASWCPRCRALEADIKNGTIPSGVTIIKVDYDKSQALRKKYGVTLQTTIVRIDDQGNLVEKFVAYDNPSLQAVTENLL